MAKNKCSAAGYKDQCHYLSFLLPTGQSTSRVKNAMKLELLTMASRDTVKFMSEKTVVKKRR